MTERSERAAKIEASADDPAIVRFALDLCEPSEDDGFVPTPGLTKLLAKKLSAFGASDALVAAVLALSNASQGLRDQGSPKVADAILAAIAEVQDLAIAALTALPQSGAQKSTDAFGDGPKATPLEVKRPPSSGQVGGGLLARAAMSKLDIKPKKK